MSKDSHPEWVYDELHHPLDFYVAGYRFKPKNLADRENMIRALQSLYGIGRKDVKREFRQLIGAVYNETD